MNSETVKQIVFQALDVEPAEREALVRQACKGDQALLAEVLSLLDAASNASDAGFLIPGTVAEDLAAPAVAQQSRYAGETAAAPIGERPGDRIGPYKLLQQIGEGGFGVVFMAEQEKPVRRTVAIKVIKLGMDTREVVARFEAERQALAMMEHPNIARVLDAGSTTSGRPYFVMELVRGSPITQFCDKNKMPTAERVALAATVCRAVQHAHSKGIIHRDLKPSNVLVTVTDGKPVPKVIDFGIAKATQTKLTDKTLFTALRQMIGTPQYMSPEQADSDGSDLDTRTDVYSLGVLIYELLVGTTPFDAKSLRAAAMEEMRRIIRDVEPPRPSTRISAMVDATLSNVATARGIEPKRLGQIIRGELDWIVMKALEKDRSRRYETAAALADELNRYLAGDAVLAGPPGGLYRLRKVARRYKAALSVAALIGLALILGVAGTTTGLVREAKQRNLAEKATVLARAQSAEADRQRAEAQQQRSKAEARFADVRQLANDFMFKLDDALINVAGATRARKMLADTASQYLDRLSRDAAADKSLNRELAISYEKVGDILGNPFMPRVGDSDRALANYQRAMEILQKLGQDDPGNAQTERDLATACEKLGDVQLEKGQLRIALASYQNSLELRQKAAGKDPQGPKDQRSIATSLRKVGGILVFKGDTAGAKSDLDKSVEIYQELVRANPDDRVLQRELSLSYDGLAGTQAADDAVVTFGKSLLIREKLVKDDPTDSWAQHNLAVTYANLGDIHFDQNKTDQALGYYSDALKIDERIAHADTDNADAQRDLSGMYVRVGDVQAARGQPDAATTSYRQSLEIYQRLAMQDPSNIAAKHNVAVSDERLGDMQARSGRTDEALATYRQTLDLMVEVARVAEGNIEAQRDVSVCSGKLGDLQSSRGLMADALASYNRCVEISKALARRNPGDGRSKSDLVRNYVALSWCQLLMGDFTGAMSSVAAGHQADPDSLSLEINRAHALLLLRRDKEAREIYMKHQGEQMPGTSERWDDVVLHDLMDLEKHGITTPGMAEIRQALIPAKR